MRIRKTKLMSWTAVGMMFVLAMAGGVALAAVEEEPKDEYPLSTCPVSGQELGSMGDPIVKTIDGREVRFCCGGCPSKFEGDPEKYGKKMDTAIAKAQAESYPLSTCVVSGEKLGGDMGDIVDYIHENKLVRFCCKGCVKDFKKDPAKYLLKLEDADAHGKMKMDSMPAESSDHKDEHGGHEQDGHH